MPVCGTGMSRTTIFHKLRPLSLEDAGESEFET